MTIFVSRVLKGLILNTCIIQVLSGAPISFLIFISCHPRGSIIVSSATARISLKSFPAQIVTFWGVYDSSALKSA